MSTWANYVEFMKSKGNIDEVMIVASDTGALWASSSPNTFFLREYTTKIAQEDGSEKDEVVNEATSVVSFMKGQPHPHGLRLNGGKKQQIIRKFEDEEIRQPCVYGKIAQGGSCVINAGRCILIAIFDEGKGHTSAGCNEIIHAMAKYLNKSEWPEGEEGSAKAAESSGGSPSGSWQQYVDTMLIGKGNVARAAIFSHTGEVLGKSAGVVFKKYQAEIAQEDGSEKSETVDEIKNILQLTLKKSKPAQGLRINEEKFQILRMFDDDQSGCYTIYGKKTRGGCCLAVSLKTVVVAVFDEGAGHSSAGCNIVVGDLVKYLKGTQN